MKTAVVTGGTRGIGKETARDLARLGATVVIVGRDEVRGAAAAAELRETTRNERVVFVPSDLSSQADVRRLAQTLADRYERLHVLVNNAAVVRARRQTTVDGIEETLAVCHLAPSSSRSSPPAPAAKRARQDRQRHLGRRPPRRARPR